MIIVKLQGGLGNQLFEYALARSVSTKLNTDFRLDPAPFNTYYKLHKYSLNFFNVREQFASPFDFFGFVWLRKHEKAFNRFVRYILGGKVERLGFYCPEKDSIFDPKVFDHDDTYFDGYWQSEKYFKGIEADLRKEIALKQPFSEYSQTVFDSINSTNSISLHVRRADYITNPRANAVHGVCTMEYYQKAIKYLADRVGSPHFFIFSDDYAWASENFKSLPFPVTCISNTAEKNYEDLMLMSSCKHNIIANSSFSWWGAWLNANRGKIVIAPKQWFKTDVRDQTNIVPADWLRM